MCLVVFILSVYPCPIPRSWKTSSRMGSRIQRKKDNLELRNAAGVQGGRVTGLQGCKVTGLQSCRVAAGEGFRGQSGL